MELSFDRENKCHAAVRPDAFRVLGLTCSMTLL